jgi:histidine triad (HIT) family protein
MSDCIFCKIANGEIPAELVYQDKDIIAFNDIKPQAPVHILFIPRQHIETLDDVKNLGIYSSIFKAIGEVVKTKNLDKDGYRVVANCKGDGGQEVYHVHFHLLGGRPMKWPPG